MRNAAWFMANGAVASACISTVQAFEDCSFGSRVAGSHIECDTIVVNSLDDPGVPDNGLTTLREAIDAANAGLIFCILFDPALAGGTIQPTSQLPDVSGEDITIDGDIDGNGTPDIELDGTFAGAASGMRLTSAYNVINGLVINRFQHTGVKLYGSAASGNTVTNCYVGTDRIGTHPLPNGGRGIWLQDGPTDNTIGPGNCVSGNLAQGVLISGGANDNTVTGCYVGTDALGLSAVPNGVYGVVIDNATDNIIGPVNIVSGNTSIGIIITGVGSANNLVSGNHIGVDASGQSGLPNTAAGLKITDGAGNNRVGGPEVTDRNIISGNGGSGITIGAWGDPCVGNVVENNYIGTDADGLVALGNGGHGIFVNNGSNGNVIGPGNVLSSSVYNGVALEGPGTELNTVRENKIGTDVTGNVPLGNGESGVAMRDGASGNTLGPDNVISGNVQNGVFIGWFGEPCSDNFVENNLIGIDADQTSAIGNNVDGMIINNGSSGNQIGPGNVIGGSRYNEIVIADTGSSGNNVFENTIGTGLPSTYAGGDGVDIRNGASGNQIGPNNIIAWNTAHGVLVRDIGTVRNTVSENSITANEAAGINLIGGANMGIKSPRLLAKVADSLFGTADVPDGSVIEVFGDPDDEGQWLIGSTSVVDGSFVLATATLDQADNITATVTDPDGNTSEFSAPLDCYGSPGDPDSDGDGVPDRCEIPEDCNGNGLLDSDEIQGAGGATVFASGIGTPAGILASTGEYPPGFLVTDLATASVIRVSPLGGTITQFASGFSWPIGATMAPDEFGGVGERLFVADPVGEEVLFVAADGEVKPFASLPGVRSDGITYVPEAIGGLAGGKLLVTAYENGARFGSVQVIDTSGAVTTLHASSATNAWTPALAPNDFGQYGSNVFFGSAIGAHLYALDLVSNELTLFATVPLPMGDRPGLRQIAFSPIGWAETIDPTLASERVLLVSVASYCCNWRSGDSVVSVWDQRGTHVADLNSGPDGLPFEPRGLLFVKNDLLISDMAGDHDWLFRVTVEDFGSSDCDGDGTLDECEIANGSSDCNENAVPDECEVDCNDNDISDSCELLDGTTADCDGNFIPDSCDSDFDGDGVIDGCDDDIDADFVDNDLDVCDFTPLGTPIDSLGRPRGDWNSDCAVALEDFGFLATCLGSSGPGVLPSSSECLTVFDADIDGDVDLSDVRVFQLNFGTGQ